VWDGVPTVTLNTSDTGLPSVRVTLWPYEAWGATIVKSFQNGTSPTPSYAGNEDTSIYENTPTANFANASTLELDGDDPSGTGKDIFTLLKWNISDIPPGNTVQSATITFNVKEPTIHVYEFYEMKRNWAENQVTWNVYSTGNNWQIAGAGGSLDRGATILGTVSSSANGSYTINLNTSGTALVQSWINSPSTNYGIIIANSVSTDGLDISSSEAATLSTRPKLTVTYISPDTTPPVLSNIQASSITSNSATITWNTDEPATTQVEYGLTTSYGQSTPLDTNLITAHSVNLSSLSSNTLYHYRVKSRDAAGNEAVSTDQTFTTASAPDTTPPVLSNIQASSITSNSATITWNTDEPATTQVEYGLTTSYGQSTPLDTNLITAHSVNLSSLSSNTLYHYRVKSRDAAGNEAVSTDQTFTTQADATPVVKSFQNGTSPTPGYAENEDTSIYENTPTANFANASTLELDGDDPSGTGKDIFTLLKWTISDIPIGSTVQSVTITFNVTDPSAHVYELYEMKRNWVENQATWEVYSTGNNWQIAGAGGSLDRGATILGIASPSTAGTYTLTLNASGVALVQSWVNSPSTNYGIIIANSVSTDGLDISSSEAATLSARPKLMVTSIPPLGTDTTPPVLSNIQASSITSNLATITWNTDEPATTQVEYGPTPSYGQSTPLDTNLITAHSVSLSGLSSNTLYHYRVRSRDAAGNEAISTDQTFTTQLNNLDSLRFAVIGDFGANSTAENNVAILVQSWNPDLVITTGDNNYPDGAASTIDLNIGKYYHQFIYPYTGSYGTGAATNRFFPSLGNHDWDTPGATPYLDYFALPGNERYYDFVSGPVHFFAVDSDSREPDGNFSTSLQATWLRNQLATSAAPWKIVYLHHPPFGSSLDYGSVGALQWPYEAWGASAVLAGHAHVYERVIINTFPYFTNGLGGGDIYNFRAIPLPESQVRYNSDYGAMLVDASTTQITFKFITRSGTLIDTYSMTIPPPIEGAVVKSFQNGTSPTPSYTGNLDTQISQSSPTSNFGSVTSLKIDGDEPSGSGQDFSVILKWNISDIPAGSTVQSAKITFEVSNSTTDVYELYEMKRNWVEDQATWDVYSTGNNWEIAGAAGSLDRGSTILGTLTSNVNGSYTINLNASGIALVQSWVDSPSTNYGIIIANSVSADGINISSSEATTLSARPKLMVTYIPILTSSLISKLTSIATYPSTLTSDSINQGINEDIPLSGDYDGDGRADIAVWRSSEGNWYVWLSGSNSFLIQPWGTPGGKPVPGDYDGDGQMDFGIWQPSTGTWFIQKSLGGSMTEKLGEPTDIPVPGDYDGDGFTDIAVFRSSFGGWDIKPSSGGDLVQKQWGQNGDVPIPGDYDGDEKTDIAIWRPPTGTWFIQASQGRNVMEKLGEPTDIPVPGDYDGDGLTDIAVFRPSLGVWDIRPSGGGALIQKQWGLNGDVPIPGDYDGDGKTDIAVWRPSERNWYINR
jgi:phosphodiesterase/alkaline phosphatase D-like protein